MSQSNTFLRSALVLEEIGVGPIWLRRALDSAVAHDAAALETPVAAGSQQVADVAVAYVASAAPAAPTPGTATRVAASERVPVAAPAAPVRSTPTQTMPAAAAVRRPPPSAADDGLPAWLHEMDDAVEMTSGFIPHDDDDDAGPAIRIDPAIASMDWPALKEKVAGCRQCGLCEGRKKTVFGVGDERAKWLFIGEGPGRNEDMQGEPFVGPAGKLLDNMLLAMGLKRGENAYIANIVKCRPTDENGRDRPPAPEEVAACMPYLQRQIALIQPTVLVALGKTAALSLLGLDPSTPVSKLRGTVHRYQELPLVVTYHPAYLLRQLGDKSKTWADLCLAMTAYAEHAR
ncbi:uracil-DNA glycosylase [Herbaspirillum autotrophicum]|uniref:uracil-DNA glycosylase n=1 Tax=Herbaspirillum autotrophicum TaxID=180195 RepID=UPI00067DCB2A|nr:uracil-DNA glycosylase [Herbaspirillum autotrophicum]